MAIDNFKEKIDISVYFYSTAPENDILNVQKDVKALPEVSDVSYISKDQAWENFKAKYSDNDVISSGVKELDENPLYATMSIKAKNIDDYQKISDYLSQEKYSTTISKINFDQNKETIDKLSYIIKSIQKWGLVISIIFVFISVFVIFNAIRLTIHNYRHEVKIMRLVGAENWYIQLPFIIEGAIYGVIGSIVSLIILVGLIYLSSNMGFLSLVANMKIVNDVTLISYLKENILLIFGIQFASGVFIGLFSSVFALRKYLVV